MRIIRNFLYLYVLIVFQVSLNFDPVKEILKICQYLISYLYFIEESDYSEESASDSSLFWEEISACVAVHMRYGMDVCDYV